jgi:ribosomal protein S12
MQRICCAISDRQLSFVWLLRVSIKKLPQNSRKRVPQKTVADQTVLQGIDLKRELLVGVAGFEPAAPASRRQCSTRLSYTPNRVQSYIASGLWARGKIREGHVVGLRPAGMALVPAKEASR